MLEDSGTSLLFQTKKIQNLKIYIYLFLLFWEDLYLVLDTLQNNQRSKWGPPNSKVPSGSVIKLPRFQVPTPFVISESLIQQPIIHQSPLKQNDDIYSHIVLHITTHDLPDFRHVALSRHECSVVVLGVGTREF